MNTRYNLRAIAAKAVAQVLDHGQSLSQLLPALQNALGDKDRALLQELCFGILRTLPQLEWIIKQLMAKPLTGKQRTVHYLLMVGIYQLLYTRIPPHAALAETVEGAVMLKMPQLKGLVNGVLRQFQRQQEELRAASEEQESRFLHPSWLMKRLQQAYPDHWQAIIEANNQRPPMWLRVNRLHHSREDYFALLAQEGITASPHPTLPDAVKLDIPCNVGRLPGFDRGWVTVQDASAQGCAPLLAPEPGEDILDLCAAPGGKTTHILELAPDARVTAVDIDRLRLARIEENLQRLGQHAQVLVGDGRQPGEWNQGRTWDRILLDAPCSATGVIRRHPDIKWLRRDRDIAELAALQQEILNATWPLLKPGGTLLYATCSILPEENGEQISAFLAGHADAGLVETGDAASPGRQCFPAPDEGDGFFYAKMIKSASPGISPRT
ncbi:16S rRNA (cytosine(967)-C(5))-methyltransferase RsmB [Acerihabitans arboris]|uniref:Ribosomal RNA small subunit methyltransferase B n=1 Tax=Acerihabitans arboris TaxID=2691583 RepID=A0A845ST93_9GAMM|nr:16S rRNA (cytosine(967)-C(5))-methyltransferase RsmB [Acerihabitans arboris]NDL65958.1 16S rRNA (cytosine(967)-C(5))-methyltransferase RsmB [Acerihabitans arboris]